MRLALVADWLTASGGAERALAELSALWPASPIYTTVARTPLPNGLRNADVRQSGLQRIYRIIGKHQLLLPWMLRAIEDADLSGHDVVVSSSHAVGKGIIPPSGSVHVCYCHTPMRYAWEMEDQYLEDFHVPRIFRAAVKRQLVKLRRWDLSTAKRVDAFIANSGETAARIERIYGRSSVVIPPPAHDRFFLSDIRRPRTGFLAVGRLVPYKRFDILISCANALRLPLVIAGSGQEEKSLKAMAGPTIEFRGSVSDNELPSLYASAEAVLFSAHEDAGIVPIEAQACGTPVIAYGKGGVRDAVIEGKTGLFFGEQSEESLAGAIRRFSAASFDRAEIRRHARQFAAERFREKVGKEVEKAVVRYLHGKSA
ncbi:glycosyltransferase [Candidatus Peregrinibacteria bacterium]|nr:glycosyltransferase [Candidatus Peregrinibacteria bacterium]